VLPNKIHSVLPKTLPSNGLTPIQISAALQQLGYAPRMYSVTADRKNQQNIFSIISDYVESGIPIVLAITREKFGGHALLFSLGDRPRLRYNRSLAGHSGTEADCIEGCHFHSVTGEHSGLAITFALCV